MRDEKTFPLRYTGDQAVTFMTHGVGEVGPERGTFEVPESALASYMRRGDVEHDGECPSPPCRCGGEPGRQAPESGAKGKPRGGRSRGATSKQDGQDQAGE